MRKVRGLRRHNGMDSGIDEEKTGYTVLVHTHYDKKFGVVYVLETIRKQYRASRQALSQEFSREFHHRNAA